MPKNSKLSSEVKQDGSVVDTYRIEFTNGALEQLRLLQKKYNTETLDDVIEIAITLAEIVDPSELEG